MSRKLVQLPYKNLVVLLPDDLAADILSVGNPGTYRDDNYKHLQYRGIITVYRNDTAIMVAKDSKVECLACNKRSLRETGYPRLLAQLPLNGTRLRLICLYPISCEHPTYRVLVEVLNQYNVSFHQEQLSGMGHNKHYSDSNRVDRTEEVVLRDQHKFVWNIEFPMKVIPIYTGSIEYTFFGKRRYPLPKEIILIVPFSRHVWIALLFAMILSSCALFVTLGFAKGEFLNTHEVVFVLVASLLQQCNQLTYSEQRHLSTRLLLGLWVVMTFVLLTAYKGSITAILKNAPLEAEHPTFPNDSSLYKQGCIVQFMVFTELRNETPEENAASIVETKYLEQRKRFTVPDKKFFPLVRKFWGRHTSTIHRRLGKFDYVPTGESFYLDPLGAQMLYASPFRKALSDSISQALESGLFTRAVTHQEFEVKFRSELDSISSAPDVLSVGDLKPFFFIWFAGLGAAVVTILLELVVSFLFALCVKGRSFTWQKQRLYVGQRWAYRRAHPRFQV